MLCRWNGKEVSHRGKSSQFKFSDRVTCDLGSRACVRFLLGLNYLVSLNSYTSVPGENTTRYLKVAPDYLPGDEPVAKPVLMALFTWYPWYFFIVKRELNHNIFWTNHLFLIYFLCIVCAWDDSIYRNYMIVFGWCWNWLHIWRVHIIVSQESLCIPAPVWCLLPFYRH